MKEKDYAVVEARDVGERYDRLSPCMPPHKKCPCSSSNSDLRSSIARVSVRRPRKPVADSRTGIARVPGQPREQLDSPRVPRLRVPARCAEGRVETLLSPVDDVGHDPQLGRFPADRSGGSLCLLGPQQRHLACSGDIPLGLEVWPDSRFVGLPMQAPGICC